LSRDGPLDEPDGWALVRRQVGSSTDDRQPWRRGSRILISFVLEPPISRAAIPELGPPLLGASVSEGRGKVTVGDAAMLSASPKRP
jgi:hypothetical protein